MSSIAVCTKCGSNFRKPSMKVSMSICYECKGMIAGVGSKTSRYNQSRGRNIYTSPMKAKLTVDQERILQLEKQVEELTSSLSIVGKIPTETITETIKLVRDNMEEDIDEIAEALVSEKLKKFTEQIFTLNTRMIRLEKHVTEMFDEIMKGKSGRRKGLK
jgi:acyl-CoA reductase-like NAD-dependent aldehyde dehydrogenase